MVKGKPTRIQYGAGSDCLVRRRTAGRLGQLDAATVGRRAGRMRDSREHQRETVRQTLKKRTQAPVLQRGRLWLKECWCKMLVHPTARQRRVRLRASSSARWKTCWRSTIASMGTSQYGDNEVLVCLDETSKQQSLPSATTGSERDALAASGPAWGGGLLRIPAQGGEQPFHVVRSAGRMAPGGSDGPANEGRLGPGGQATVDEDYRTRTVLCR